MCIRDRAYEAGVDDCMPKPVSPSLFQAKVKVWLRRFGSLSTENLNVVKVGTLQLFPAERMVMLKNGGVIQLTNLELRLLYYLMNRPGQIVTTEELNQRVWGYTCLLYTSDAADERSSVDLGGRRIIKK